MAIVDELITLLGFEEDAQSKQTSENFKKRIEGIKSAVTQASAVIVGMSAVIGAWTAKVAAGVDEGGKFARSVNVAYENLQELEFAAVRSGGSVGELRADIAKLTSDMSSPIPGEFSQELLILGISARDATGQLRSADQVLLDLADRFENFDNIRAQQFGQRLGLSQGTIRLLQQGRDGVEQLRQEARDLGAILPEESVIIAERFTDELTNVRFALDGLQKTVAIGVLPVFTDAIQAFREFFVANREIISSGITSFINGVTQGFGKFVQIITKVVDKVSQFLGPLETLTGDLTAVEVISGATVAAFTALAAILTVAIAKFLAIAAPIAAIALLFEDLIVFISGGDSALGRLLDTFEKRFPGIFGLIKTFANLIKNTVGVAFDFIGEKIEFVFDKVKGFFNLIGKGLDFIDRGLQKLGFGDDEQPQVAAAGASAPVPQSVFNQGGSFTQGNNTIIVNGAGSPLSVANEVVNRAGFSNTQQIAFPGINTGVSQ